MTSVSPPKPWERAAAGGRSATATAPAPNIAAAPSLPTSQPSTAMTTTSSISNPPALPDRPSTLADSVNRNASQYSPYGANRVGGLGTSPYGGIGSTYSSPYSRLGGMGGYGGYGSSMYGGMGGYGSGMYGGMGGYGAGMGMGGMYGGMPGQDPNNVSLTQAFSQSTQATFQIIESIVGAASGFAQMLESTYMATHSSFFAMVSVAEQFGNLRTTLGSVLGIFTILRWLRTLIAKITGRPPPADATALTPAAFAKFEGRPHVLPDGTPGPAAPRFSKKPFFVFLVAAFGLPYLMGKLIKSLAANQEAAERERLAAQGLQLGPDGQPIPVGAAPGAPIDPSKLDFCRVMWDFAPEQGAAVQGVDLEVKKGDLVAVLSKSDPLGQPSQWWRCRARDGRVGYLPAPYLAPVQPRQPGQVATIKSASRAGSQAGSRADSLDSRTTGMAPVLPGGKAGDLSVESFQKSQFYS